MGCIQGWVRNFTGWVGPDQHKFSGHVGSKYLSIGSTSGSQPSWQVQPFLGGLGTIFGALGLGILLRNLSLWCISLFLDLGGRSFWTLGLSGVLGTFLEAHGLGFLLGNLSFRGRRLLCSLSLDFGLLRGHFWHFFRGSRPRHSFWGPDLSLRASL